MIRRVLHDGVTYYFSKPSRVAVQIGVPPAAGPVDVPPPERFALLLNHGLRPQDEAYSYIVLPVGVRMQPPRQKPTRRSRRSRSSPTHRRSRPSGTAA